ncbi:MULTISPECIES: hypothetical protein [unclassified Roseateles]|uniref:hypothetical protein n=1 Tax=Pelomonas sp. Root1237 TaxID=1736434 RepID=UPI000701CBB8|nr:hypothetical protein [Pelomonas sp. Root1237]KQV89114.1 hypothetical protein ASC91_10795 [Pelomonas sp. Root1237]
MHVEPPGHAPTNFKELGVHYVMIVLGILTALGLEAGFEALHHRKLARQTIEQVDSELQANLTEVRSTIMQNRTVMEGVNALYGEVKKLAEQGQAKPATLKTLLSERLHISVFTPGLRRDAWDTALADQALVHLPHADLRRLSEAYTAQRDSQQVIQSSFSAIGSFTRLTDALVDAEFGRGDPVDLIKALHAYRLTLNVVIGVEKGLEKQLAQSLGEAAVPAPAASAASAH